MLNIPGLQHSVGPRNLCWQAPQLIQLQLIQDHTWSILSRAVTFKYLLKSTLRNTYSTATCMHTHTRACTHTYIHKVLETTGLNTGDVYFSFTQSPKLMCLVRWLWWVALPQWQCRDPGCFRIVALTPCGFKAALVPSYWHVEGWSGEACVESFRCCSWKMEYSLWHSPWPDLVTWLTVREARECRWASTRICQHCQMLHSIRQRWCI